jgi:hypothetical protein
MDKTIAIRCPSLVISLKIVCCAASLVATHLPRSLRLPNVRRKRHQKKPTPRRYPLQISDIKSIEMQRDQQRTFGMATYKVSKGCSDCNPCIKWLRYSHAKATWQTRGITKGSWTKSQCHQLQVGSITNVHHRLLPTCAGKIPARISMA